MHGAIEACSQEASAKPANTPSDIKRLEEEYGNVVDFHRCEDIYNDFNTKSGRRAADSALLDARALELRKLLRDREEEILVV
jgi:hypothetical protein